MQLLSTTMKGTLYKFLASQLGRPWPPKRKRRRKKNMLIDIYSAKKKSVCHFNFASFPFIPRACWRKKSKDEKESNRHERERGENGVSEVWSIWDLSLGPCDRLKNPNSGRLGVFPFSFSLSRSLPPFPLSFSLVARWLPKLELG